MPVPAPPIYAAYELSLSKKMLPSAKCATAWFALVWSPVISWPSTIPLGPESGPARDAGRSRRCWATSA